MEKVVGVRFKHANKTYYFSPNGIELEIGDKVVVETARGVELGTIIFNQKELSPDHNMEVKPILRKATEKDLANQNKSREEKNEALRLCQEKVQLHNLDMKLVDVEYTLDNSKIIFFFTSDGRVDFRDLVKDLAAIFKMRIELRQIGVRDEAKMIGGIGSCGRGLCCSKWLSEFQPVSIKMAKTQNLSLNPAKISGICGRLMCCLNYENDNYLEAEKGMPAVGETIKTPDGEAVVMEVNILQNIIKAKIESKDKKSVAEVKEYSKEEIKRDNRHKCCCKKAHREEELSEDVKALLKE